MLGGAVHPIMRGTTNFPLFSPYFPTPRCRYGAIYGWQVSVEEKRRERLGRLAWLPIPRL